ncbi:MAG TPA: thiamine-phosphate kinase [Candidatus Nitrosotalea sp.]|nr:thiamine-phosphate kinase [Candidatus Nitrosotalea sp.]
MNELDLLGLLRPHLAPRGPELLIAAGEDDAACWREADESFTVATCDTAVEGVHFDLAQQAPFSVGWRAMAFALGDLAAKGAAPAYGLVAVSLGPHWEAPGLEQIYAGLSALAQRVGLALVGGDTTRSPHDGSITLTLLGRTRVLPLARSQVEAGWVVAVSGALGGSSLAVERPLPRLELGAELCARGVCCGDISDGLLRELDKFSAASGLGARLELDRVPRAPGASALGALASGEEVELVCVGPPHLLADLYQVGEITSGPQVLVVGSGGETLEVAERGYDHLA